MVGYLRRFMTKISISRVKIVSTISEIRLLSRNKAIEFWMHPPSPKSSSKIRNDFKIQLAKLFSQVRYLNLMQLSIIFVK